MAPKAFMASAESISIGKSDCMEKFLNFIEISSKKILRIWSNCGQFRAQSSTPLCWSIYFNH
ncbi:hypothetical protein [Rubritalea tangerina]|uniref:hypothetical protein n=1 Tax=Rubritalea tangerina TaxID=430798 RepID=UPI003613494F